VEQWNDDNPNLEIVLNEVVEICGRRVHEKWWEPFAVDNTASTFYLKKLAPAPVKEYE
jgi:hypothetical protein